MKNTTLPPIENLIEHLLRESHQTELFWQIGLLLACALLSWGMMRLLSGFFLRSQAKLHIDPEVISRIGQPFIGLLLIVLGRSIMQQWHESHLLDIAVPLVGALVLIRILVYMLRYAFKSSETIKIWERYIAWTIWLGFALHITGLLPRITAALDAVSFEAGKHRFSLLLLLETLTVIVIAVIAALWIAQLIETRLMRITSMDASLRLALIKTTRTLLLIIGILFALPAVGIDITVLSVFGGALGVGLGLGLQKVASNYLSGFIILLDRSIRPGDMVTVDNHYGEVSQLNTRYTLLRAQDGTEIIIPNETIMTSTVVNHSYTRRDERLVLPVQVSYSSDLEQAFHIITTAAMNHERVLKNENAMPRVLITAFTDSGIDLELNVWIDDPEESQTNLRSELYLSIWQGFKAAHIEIPYPRHDIQIINSPAKL